MMLSAFNGNYIEYESNTDKNENFTAKKYLNMIRPYLRFLINDHKDFKNLKVETDEIIEELFKSPL